MNAEIGLSPFETKPERMDFVNWIASSQAESIDSLAARQKRLAEIQPLLREVMDTTASVRTDLHYRKAMERKQRMLNLAETRWAEQPAREAALDALAERYGVERVMDLGNGRKMVP